VPVSAIKRVEHRQIAAEMILLVRRSKISKANPIGWPKAPCRSTSTKGEGPSGHLADPERHSQGRRMCWLPDRILGKVRADGWMTPAKRVKLAGPSSAVRLWLQRKPTGRRRIRGLLPTRRPPAPHDVVGDRANVVGGLAPGPSRLASRGGCRWLRCRARPAKEDASGAQPHLQGRMSRASV